MDNGFLLELNHISKSFPGVKALDDVHFDLRAGELHALLGENGAGKSTLIKILAGIYTRDAGEILYQGKPADIQSVNDARSMGISVIHQEISLVPQLSVVDNILLGTEGNAVWVKPQLRKKAVSDMMRGVGYELDIDAKVGSLSIAQQQIVEIVRALTVQNTRVMIMDEPTASIAEEDAKKLFTIIDQLKKKGIGIIYISHRMEEVLQIADRITVFRDGQYVQTKNAGETDIQDIISMMVGRRIDNTQQYNIKAVGETVLEMRDIRNKKLHGVNFELRRGEVHGLYGLVGSGRTELAQVLFGIDRFSGEIRIGGKRASIRSPRDSMKSGIALVPENRKKEGLSLMHSIRLNSILTTSKRFIHGMHIERKRMNAFLAEQKEALNIKYASPDYRVMTMSGGNQQKVVLSKWLATQPEILILDEPTRGIDIGAKFEIYELIFKLIEQGKSIILITSELSEIINLSTRVSVMREGRITNTLERADFTQEKIVSYALTDAAKDLERTTKDE